MATIQLFPFSDSDLMQIPPAPRSGPMQVTPHVFWDTITYTDNADTTLPFFGTARAANTGLSNLPNGGVLAPRQWFHLQGMELDFLTRPALPTATSNVSVLDDIQQLVMTGKPWFTIIYDGNPLIGPIPLSHLHSSGGVGGIVSGTFTAATAFEHGQNSIPDGGLTFLGQGTKTNLGILFGPQVPWTVEVRWPAAVDLTGNTTLQVKLRGAWYRPWGRA